MKINFKKSIPPESFLYTGNVDFDTSIRHLQYNKKAYNEFKKEVPIKSDVVDWIIVEGLSNTDAVVSFCSSHNIDNLIVEDILNVNQRNKIEVYDKYIFAVQKYTYYENNTLKTDYISLVLFEDKLISFSEKENLFISNILERIKKPNALIRQYKHDYLFYVIFDIITDEVTQVYHYIVNQVDEMEADLLKLDRNDELVLYQLRKELVYVRNYSNQLLSSLFNNQNLIKRLKGESTGKYYDDLLDHIVNLNEKSRTELELLKGIFDIYMNNNSHKMNQIMKTLTIFSAIFIPLSFLTGIFGMNFTNFPLLSNEYGIFIFIGISILIPVSMLLYFKKNKWF